MNRFVELFDFFKPQAVDWRYRGRTHYPTRIGAAYTLLVVLVAFLVWVVSLAEQAAVPMYLVPH